MPLIDFGRLKQLVPLRAALDLIGWKPTRERWGQARGPCPVHSSRSTGSTTFHVTRDKWFCHKCLEGGDVLRLWCLLHNLDAHAAAVGLCRRLGLAVPWMPRGQCRPRRPRKPRPPRKQWDREEAR